MAIFDGITKQQMMEQERRKRLMQQGQEQMPLMMGQPGMGASSPQLNGMGAVLDGLDMSDPLTALAVRELMERMGG